MSSAQAQDFSLLLQVFREGITRGWVAKEEIIAWADAIILQDDEPEYFFIELALCNNVNGIIEVLGKYTNANVDPICYRVLLSLICHRFLKDNVEDAAKTADFAGRIATWDNPLSAFEKNCLYDFEEHVLYYSPDELYAELDKFLGIYKLFTLENYSQWVDINTRVLLLLDEEQAMVEMANAIIQKEWAEKNKKRKRLRLAKKALGILILCSLLVLIAMLRSTEDGSSTNLYFIPAYFICWLIYWWWKKIRR
jgi:hypothetical protein